MTIQRYLRTPKGMCTLVLLLLLAIAAAHAGVALVAPVVLAASIAAVVIDAPILRVREGKWVLPDGALLTGLLVAMVLSPFVPWHVAAITSAIGIASKYILRANKANIFNPAALGLVATFNLFGTGQSWWGALPELSTAALVVLIAAGAFMADRVKKMPALIGFLGVYYALVTATAFVGNPATVAGLYRAPDLHAALFFAFFMVSDPPTSPPKGREQAIFGAIVAVASFLAYEAIGSAYFLLVGLLVANVWEAWRRARARSLRALHRAPTH